VGIHPAGIVQLQWGKYGVIASGVLNYGRNFRKETDCCCRRRSSFVPRCVHVRVRWSVVQASIYLLCNGPRAARSLSKDISTVSHSVLSAAHTSPASHTQKMTRGEDKTDNINYRARSLLPCSSSGASLVVSKHTLPGIVISQPAEQKHIITFLLSFS
jgi:hypothetical protein